MKGQFRRKLRSSKLSLLLLLVNHMISSAYLFQIAQEKSCDYLLIMYMKKFRDGSAEETHAYHAIWETLRHLGCALDLKAKYLIGHL